MKLRHHTASQNLFLSITSEGAEPAIDVQTLSDAVASAVDVCELRRVDVQDTTVQVVYYVAATEYCRRALPEPLYDSRGSYRGCLPRDFPAGDQLVRGVIDFILPGVPADAQADRAAGDVGGDSDRFERGRHLRRSRMASGAG